jgi:hypothetical protein
LPIGNLGAGVSSIRHFEVGRRRDKQKGVSSGRIAGTGNVIRRIRGFG